MPCCICGGYRHNRRTCIALQDAKHDIQTKLNELKVAEQKKAEYEAKWQTVKAKEKKQKPTTGKQEEEPEQQYDDESEDGIELVPDGKLADMDMGKPGKPHRKPSGQGSVVIINRVTIG